MRRGVWAALLACLAPAASGCAPPRFVDGVHFVAQQYGASSPDKFAITGYGYLRLSHALRSDLGDLVNDAGDDALPAEGIDVLQAAERVAVRAADDEISRMPPAALSELVRRYPSDVNDDVPGLRADLIRRFQREAGVFLAEDLERLRAADAPTARRFFRSLLVKTAAPAGDRGKIGRTLLAAPLFLPAVIGAEMADADAAEREMVADFEHIVRYDPPEMIAAGSDLSSATPEQLAGLYAPVILQQIDRQAEYPVTDDALGRIRLAGSPSQIEIRVDPGEPVVYWTTRTAKIGKQRYEQLLYVGWYPHRPALVANDPEAGDLDGLVLRITLDRHHRPAIYEFVRSCGCYHTLWVAEFVEAAAREEYGPPQDEHYAVQRAEARRALFLPALVSDDGARPRRPLAWVSSGHHLLMRIGPESAATQLPSVQESRGYELEPYETLTRLPLGDGIASMFGADGLAHNTGRAEGWLLAPTGMLSAGQPRQLGTMKIRVDAYDYDDPRLLERNLRLPSGF